jgi:threonine synthase
MNHSSKFKYICVNCGRVYQENEVQYLCPACAIKNTNQLPPKGILKVEYDFTAIKIQTKECESIYEKYLPLLPILSTVSLPNLRIGDTPVYSIDKEKFGVSLFLKDDSQNPTYSFKDRASGMVSAIAKEKGINRIVTASTGNAGSSIAGICAAQNQQAIVFVPAKAPVAKLTQILMYGAQIVPVDGTYDDAFDLSMELSNLTGWYNRNTAYNPITIEGKKTVAFEIFEQFGLHLPDYIYIPVGDGVILAGLYKGFEDLLRVGLIEKIPTIVAVQAAHSHNIVHNLNQENPVFPIADSIADSINVNIPRNYYMAVDYLKKYQGIGIEVSNNEILQASAQIAQMAGLFAEPAATAAFAGFVKFRPTVSNKNIHLVLLTGSGLKDLHAVRQLLPTTEPVECNITSVKKVLKF